MEVGDGLGAVGGGSPGRGGSDVGLGPNSERRNSQGGSRSARSKAAGRKLISREVGIRLTDRREQCRGEG